VSLLIDSQYKKFILFQPYKKIKRYKTYFRWYKCDFGF
jgi:hypothetical protein